MSDFLLDFFNRSLTAGYLIVAVLALRLILRKAPKWARLVLWALVALRLCLPFSLESSLSLIPREEIIEYSEEDGNAALTVHTGISAVNNFLDETLSGNSAYSQSVPAGAYSSVNAPFSLINILVGLFWILGILVMLFWALISSRTVQLHMGKAVKVIGRIYECPSIPSPFINGVFMPEIYIPADMDPSDVKYVMDHEQAHIRRGDFLWKPLAWLILSVHWFNPLVWVSYFMFTRDLELACDEAAIGNYSKAELAAYSVAILKLSAPRYWQYASPLAFGGSGIKERVRAVLSYKKPRKWVIAVSMLLTAATAACFLTVPYRDTDSEKDAVIREIPDSGIYYTESYIIDNEEDRAVYSCKEEINYISSD